MRSQKFKLSPNECPQQHVKLKPQGSQSQKLNHKVLRHNPFIKHLSSVRKTPFTIPK